MSDTLDSFFEIAAGHFASCNNPEETWAEVVKLSSGLFPGWISYGVTNREQTKLYAYRTTLEMDFADYFLANKLIEVDYIAKHCTLDKDTLYSIMGEPLPCGRYAKRKPLLDPHLEKFGIKAVLCEPFREGDLYSGMTCWITKRPGVWLDDSLIRKFRTLARLFRSYYEFTSDPDSYPEYLDRYRVGVLTPREREALYWLAEGEQTEGIGTRMTISVPGAKKHLASARRKMGARNREQALALALRNGLVHLRGK